MSIGTSFENGPHSLMTPTFARRVRSRSTTKLIKCVVPVVTLVICRGSTLDCSNIDLMTLLIPPLGFLVVLVFFQGDDSSVDGG